MAIISMLQIILVEIIKSVIMIEKEMPVREIYITRYCHDFKKIRRFWWRRKMETKEERNKRFLENY